MPKTSSIALIMATAAVACSPQPDTDEAADGTDATQSAPARTASLSDSASPEPGSALPPETADRRYVGRWAAKADLCETGAWIFTRDHLATAGEVSCDFTKVVHEADGYRVQAMCTAQAPSEKDEFTLHFAESARAMLVEGSSVLADTGLIYCGEA